MIVGKKLVVINFILISLALFCCANLVLSKSWGQSSPDILTTSASHQFNWDNILLGAIALNSKFSYSDQKLIKSYMQIYKPQQFDILDKNEFSHDRLLQEASDEILTKVQPFKISKKFTLFAGFQLGSYNFQKKAFNFQPFKENSFLMVQSKYDNDLPKKFQISFMNFFKINSLPMNQKNASILVDNLIKQDRNNRTIYGDLQFSLIMLKENDFTYPMTEIIAEITDITLYSDGNKTDLILSYNLQN